MAENERTSDEKVAIEGLPSCIDSETLRKLKELCSRYGKETVKEMVTDAEKAA